MGVDHHHPHMCPDCELCWCDCYYCKTHLEQKCVCTECDCSDYARHYHDDCPSWRQTADEGEGR